ncbi:hypothetical protein S7711_02834 [Stachybotrys chartarum IBT 7711]|uniref:Rhodopsin domain-containing protein n=1 Tax=Stachybotrys chartarum (strain CBS 109288 / IBT 7711) TaxID=1280523 RepID=A0A084AH51_STACB|nr:hypothetical protein S7711_02834 [Stachybotrys chartarum IBT 7711]
MRIVPTGIYLSWPTPNYEDPQTRGVAGKVVAISLMSITTVVLILRFYSRLWVTKGRGLDDALIFAAFFPALGFSVASIMGEIHAGWDRHVWDLRPSVWTASLQLTLLTYSLFTLASGLTKLSLIAMVHRLAGPSRVKTRIIVKGFAALVTANMIIFIFITVFQCRPISAYWTVTTREQSCIDNAKHLLAASCINTIMDFLVVLLPLTVVTRLQLPWKQYATVLGLFGLGFGATIAAAVRTYYTWYMTVDYDMTWHGWTVALTSSIELHLGIICASVPALRPLLSICSSHIISSVRSTRTNKSTNLSSSMGSDMKDSASMTHILSGPPFERTVTVSSDRVFLDHKDQKSLEMGSLPKSYSGQQHR